MGRNRKNQTMDWVKRYRIFLCLLLLAVLVLVSGLYYGLYHENQMPKEGTLVHSEIEDERKA